MANLTLMNMFVSVCTHGNLPYYMHTLIWHHCAIASLASRLEAAENDRAHHGVHASGIHVAPLSKLEASGHHRRGNPTYSKLDP